MIDINIPGYKHLRLDHLVLDYNGTIACDGKPLAGVKTALRHLSNKLQIHILTADTFGDVQDKIRNVAGNIVVIDSQNQDLAKREYLFQLDPESVAAIGNGRNDRLMIKAAALGIAVVQQEGSFAQTLLYADVVCTDILSALSLLSNPLRLVATLRS